jgi:serine/threonine-protein kinase
VIEGTRIGAYEVGAQLGVGGMGEVYRALDTRLGRHVAIKVLPPALAQDPERLARFEREARTLATLNHPNIAAIHGLEEADGVKALVMELVEGPTLADRLAARALPVDEALAIAEQIAEALAAAHEQGIIHRDLKPANVKVRQDGMVKVLDFGLAKALEPVVSGTTAGTSASLSPTITSPAMTMAGMILGTAAYMSPEQARGKPVDRRADIWSFGCVLFEMLSGQRAFEAEDVSLTLSKVLQRDPDFAALPAEVPPNVAQTLRVCLRKDPRTRASDIHDVRLALDGAFHTSTPVHGAANTRQANRFGWAVAAAVLALAAAAAYAWWPASRLPDGPMTALNVDLGRAATRAARGTVALSPDGTRMVFVGTEKDAANQQLFIQRLDRVEEPTPLLGTWLGPPISAPFFAPYSQGEWIGFFAGQTVNKVPADGRKGETIATLPSAALGGSWSEDGTIYAGTVSGLYKIPSGGGTPELVSGGRAKGFPDVLPGGRAVLINVAPVITPGTLEELDIEAYVVATGETKSLGLVGYAPRYLPTSGRVGHVIYVSKGTLHGVAFDPERVQVLGKPARVLDNVGDPDIFQGGGQFATSASGAFGYLTGRSPLPQRPMVWMDSTGKTAPLMPPAEYAGPRLSPDNQFLAYTMQGPKGGDVWVRNLKTGTSVQLTFTGPGLREVAWAPSGKHLVFGDGVSLWWIKADGSAKPLRILEKSNNPRPFSFTRDGRLVYTFLGPSAPPDIATLRIDLTDPDRPKAGMPEPFLTEDYAEVDPAFSSDGRFLAYSSTEDNTNNLYVTTFPSRNGNWKISMAGGKFPVWTPSELFFLGGDNRIMVVRYTIRGDSFVQEEDPRPWSPVPVRRDAVRQNFDMMADRSRAVVFPRPAAVQETENLHATFLLNFFDEIRRRIPIP